MPRPWDDPNKVTIETVGEDNYRKDDVARTAVDYGMSKDNLIRHLLYCKNVYKDLATTRRMIEVPKMLVVNKPEDWEGVTIENDVNNPVFIDVEDSLASIKGAQARKKKLQQEFERATSVPRKDVAE